MPSKPIDDLVRFQAVGQLAAMAEIRAHGCRCELNEQTAGYAIFKPESGRAVIHQKNNRAGPCPASRTPFHLRGSSLRRGRADFHRLPASGPCATGSGMKWAITIERPSGNSTGAATLRKRWQASQSAKTTPNAARCVQIRSPAAKLHFELSWKAFGSRWETARK